MSGEKISASRKSIVLPSRDYVVHQWLVRNGSAVQAGDKLATAIRTSNVSLSSFNYVEPGSSTAAATATPVVQHKRPTKRKRTIATSTNQNADTVTAKPVTMASSVSTVKKLSAYLPKDDLVSIVSPCAGVLRMVQPPPTQQQQQALTIGYVEPCAHPAIMDGLCAVCGTRMGQPKQEPPSTKNAQSNHNMSQVTVSGGVTMTISETEARQISQQTSQRLLKEEKLSLVLDLDHTLVHATADVRARNHFDARTDVRTLILPALIMEAQQQQQYKWMQHYVKLRPHVEEFLRKAQNDYEISVYTAGTRSYAEHVCMLLCRDMVGATKDEDELQRMRHRVMSAQQELANTSAAAKNKQLEVAKQEEASTPSTLEAKRDETIILQDDKDDTEETPTETNGNTATKESNDKTKNKVSFGEPAEAARTDAMTPARLSELEQELQDAETKEQEALNVRQRVFGSRIVSRTDVGDLGRDVKSLERIFPGGGSMALIVDDREDVWANAQDNSKQQGEPPENLLLIRPYHWKPFLGFADVNNAAGEDISGESTTTEDEDDCALLWTLDILERMHKRFFSAVRETGNRGISNHIAVPPLIRKMRQEVLQGCTLVFSGLIPLHHQNRTSRFPRSAVVRYGECLGARVLDNVDETVTHVVAARDGTDKIHRARRVPGCVIVKASWLMECVWTLTRRDVTPHLLGKPSVSKSTAKTLVASGGNSIAGSSSTDDDDDDDDDLAAQLEADMMG